jgi:hypothetical protein
MNFPDLFYVQGINLFGIQRKQINSTQYSSQYFLLHLVRLISTDKTLECNNPPDIGNALTINETVSMMLKNPRCFKLLSVYGGSAHKYPHISRTSQASSLSFPLRNAEFRKFIHVLT